MIYRKPVGDDMMINSIIEGNYIGVIPANYFEMMTNTEIMSKGDTPLKQLKIVEKPSDISDIIYIEAELPPPMKSCELLMKRTYFSMKEHPEFAKELGLHGLKHNYYIVYQHSIDLPEYPLTGNRVETKATCWLIEENLQENVMKFKAVTSQKIPGITSAAMADKLGPQNAASIFGRMLGNYFKQFGKDKAENGKP